MIRHENVDNLESKHKCEHDGYEYYKRVFLPRDSAKQCTVSVYEIPPQKAAYPYHSHTKNEEVFYIISGEGACSKLLMAKKIYPQEIYYTFLPIQMVHIN